MVSKTIIENFDANFRGELIQRSDERYEEARKLYNGMIDKRPFLIARCVDVADVITAVNFGREEGACSSRSEAVVTMGSRPPASQVSLSAEAPCTLHANTASRSKTCSRQGGDARVSGFFADRARGSWGLCRPKDGAFYGPVPEELLGRRACAVISSYNGPAEEGEKVMARLLKSVPEPIFNWMSTMPFPAMQALFDSFFPI
jgi:hypothetical protein